MGLCTASAHEPTFLCLSSDLTAPAWKLPMSLSPDSQPPSPLHSKLWRCQSICDSPADDPFMAHLCLQGEVQAASPPCLSPWNLVLADLTVSLPPHKLLSLHEQPSLPSPHTHPSVDLFNIAASSFWSQLQRSPPFGSLSSPITPQAD